MSSKSENNKSTVSYSETRKLKLNKYTRTFDVSVKSFKEGICLFVSYPEGSGDGTWS